MNAISPRFEPSTLFTEFQHRELNVLPDHFVGRTVYLLTDQEIQPPQLFSATRITSTRNLTPAEVREGIFYIYFLCDSDALPEIKRIHADGGIYVPHLSFTKTTYRFVDRLALEAMTLTETKDGLASDSILIHENICEALAMTADIPGDIIEIGVFKGSSALTTLHYLDALKASNRFVHPRHVWLLDTFDGFNYQEAQSSSDAIWTGTHRVFGVDETIQYLKKLLGHVRTSFSLVECNICVGDLPRDLGKIAVANLDVDMYEPTLIGLYKLSPKMQPGGIIICEDAASTPGLYGALLAMEEFLGSSEGKKYVQIFKGGQYFLIRKHPQDLRTALNLWLNHPDNRRIIKGFVGWAFRMFQRIESRRRPKKI